MASTVYQFQQLTAEIAPVLANAKLATFFEIDQRTFLLFFSTPLMQSRLLISLQEPLLGFHLAHEKYEMQSTAFTKTIDGHLSDARLISFTLLNEDRILECRFRPDHRLVIEFFPKRPNLYLLDAHNTIILSLNPTERTSYVLPDKPSFTLKKEVLPRITNAEMEASYLQAKQHLHFQREKRLLGLEIEKHLKKCEKDIDKWRKKYKQCSQWTEKQHEAALLQANLYRMSKGMNTVCVNDWERDYIERSITLNPKFEPAKEVSLRFKESQKLKEGLPVASRYLENAEVDRNLWKKWKDALESADSLDSLERIRKEASLSISTTQKQAKDKEEKTKPYHEFQSTSGFSIRAGKNARSNEVLTFSLARGSDIWMHVSGYPGSHVILSVPKGKKANQEDLLDAMQIALAYSQAKEKGEVEVVVTQRKYVSRLGKGRVGQVQISQHETRWEAFDKARFEAIKKRIKVQ
jgi:predicted ribosome quality control (RQC) complex YloA/Tae2 family protein